MEYRPLRSGLPRERFRSSACAVQRRRFHDGLIPLTLAILARTQSASSLRRLLRNPLGFVWTYGCGWRMPESSEEPLVLDAPGFGNLVHMVLERALQDIEADGGLAAADEEDVQAAVGRAVDQIAALWESERALPPAIVWRRTLSEVGELAAICPARALTARRRSAELIPNSKAACRWDPNAPVTIPGAAFNISGYIDRLDIAADGKRALVRDYKTGKAPKEDALLDGGRELQRCL